MRRRVRGQQRRHIRRHTRASLADVEAILRTNGSVGPRNVAQYMSGPYCFEHIDIKCSMLTTNKTPSGTYRGPGRFETDFARERMIDLIAKDLGMDRLEIRRRNLVADAQMPYPLASITPYDSSTELDSGDYHAVFDRCIKEFNWAEKSKLRGREIDGYYHGLAVGSFIEGGAAGPKEEVRLVLETDGKLRSIWARHRSGRASRRSWHRSPPTRWKYPMRKLRSFTAPRAM